MGFWDAFNQASNDIFDSLGIGTQRRQQEFNSAEAQKQRDWETKMSNTAHQREVADMQAAGINPALTATGGSGASTPSGASASSGIQGSALGGIAAVINSAATIARDKKMNENIRNDIYSSSQKIMSSAVKLARLIK